MAVQSFRAVQPSRDVRHEAFAAGEVSGQGCIMSRNLVLSVCRNCEKTSSTQDPLYAESWIMLTMAEGSMYVCSAGCLTEFAWKLRESQPKLSKSRQP